MTIVTDLKPFVDPSLFHRSLQNLKRMKNNLGSIDKMVRISLALVIALLYFTNLIHGTAAILLGILALVLAVTGLIGFCPLYAMFHISSLNKNKPA